MDRVIAQTAFLICQRPPQQRGDVLARQRLERENLAAAQERRIDSKEWVLRSGPEENDSAFLDVRQQDILLRPIEVMQFVDEQDGPLPRVFEAGSSGFQDFADLLDAGG